MESIMNQTWWIYDLTVLAILAWSVWGGWERGILHTALKVIAYPISMGLASLVATPISQFIYNTWIADRLTTYINEEGSSLILEWLENILSLSGISFGFDFTALAPYLGNFIDSTGIGSSLIDTYLEPVIVDFLDSLVFFVVFLLILFVMRRIIGLIGNRIHIPIIGIIDQIMGLVIGCIGAVCLLYLMKKGTTWLVTYGANSLPFFREDLIDKTFLFKYIYRI